MEEMNKIRKRSEIMIFRIPDIPVQRIDDPFCAA